MKWVCHWCGEPVKYGRKFCCTEHREEMKYELEWYAREVKPLPRFWIRQYIVHTTTPHWRQLQPWQYDRLEYRGYQKRTFLHE